MSFVYPYSQTVHSEHPLYDVCSYSLTGPARWVPSPEENTNRIKQQQHRQTKSKHQKHKSNNNKWFYLRLILWVIVSKRNSSFSCDHTNIIRAQNDYSVQPQPHTHICTTTQTNSTSTRFDGSEDILEQVVIIITPSDRYIIESVRLFFDFKNLIFL